MDLLHDRFEIVSGGDSKFPEERGCQSERVAKVLHELVPEQERERVAQLLDPAQMLERLRREKSYSFTYSIEGDGEESLTKNMVVLAIDLRLGRVCLVRTDVTDMLKAEREAKRTLEAALSEAEKASRVKSDFLSSMSHDIRTPMNAIVGMTALAQANISHFRGDMLRIKQILINLLSNAIKFTMEGGRVSFRLEEIDCETAGKARYRFTVSDTGIGMSEEFQQHLFEPFIRSERVSGVEGTGLGLSITKGLVDLMGGEIQLESRLGQGTTFRIELEFDAVDNGLEARIPGRLKEEDKRSMEGLHFLLVEDNAINSEILGELLQMRGATYVLKEDGRQAVEEFQNSSPGTYDAIFMDVQMPVMNGYEATRAIRALPRPDAGAIVILAMTANAFAEDVQKAMESGMNGHIAKPVDMKLLQTTLSELLPPGKRQNGSDSSCGCQG